MAQRILNENILPYPHYDFLVNQLHEHEGYRNKAYKDTVGVLTIGYGHNCEAWPVEGVEKVGDTITLEQANLLFSNDLSLCMGQVEYALPWIMNLGFARRAVLVNMTFNMGLGSVASGRGLMGFKKMLAAVEKGDYETAAKEMLNSKWATQVGSRATTLSEQMRTNQWDGRYAILAIEEEDESDYQPEEDESDIDTSTILDEYVKSCIEKIPSASEVIFKALDGDVDPVALDAAKFIVESVFGKTHQPIKFVNKLTIDPELPEELLNVLDGIYMQMR